MHIFYKQRVVDIVDGRPKWAELDEKSDLMDEVRDEQKSDKIDVAKAARERVSESAKRKRTA